MANAADHVTDFLADMSSFLDDKSLFRTPDTQPHLATTANAAAEQLPASHLQLIKETDALLSALDTPAESPKDPSPTTSSGGESDDHSVQEVFQIGKHLASAKRELQNAKAAVRRERYRQKVRQEKELLVQQEQLLAVQLNRLKEERRESQARDASRGGTLSAWKAVAARQLEKRQVAEQQQHWLRRTVADRLLLIHKMNLVVQQCLAADMEATRRLAHSNDLASCKDPTAPLFKILLSDISSLYLQTSEVFDGLHMKSSIPVAYDMTRKWNGGVEYFDSADKMVVPFDFDRTSRAWSLVLMTGPEQTFQDATVSDTITFRLNDIPESGNWVMHCAARRFRGEGRVVFVWRAVTEGQGKFEGLHTDESGWLVVRPLPEELQCAHEAKAARSSTLLESYCRLIPVGFNSDTTKQLKDQFVATIARSGHESSIEMEKVAQKMLLGAA
ncbi:uncharacterized protein IUM83_17603 [Phytophthora cinnamomi]|uniref:uncharacterized protein n=1 Tax=Phytophthora cinnamomi TaxID=4785 RepID=UPI00355AAECC|nr:hypothetical protein IUM83_17603 [Phytophthora cinnamomi]